MFYIVKKSRYGKLKFFDYINRLIILGLIIAIGVLVTKHVEENIDETSNLAQSDSKSAIIYTPINYQVDNSVSDIADSQTATTTTNQNTDSKQKVSDNSSDTNSSSSKTISVSNEEKIHEKQILLLTRIIQIT